MIELGSNILAVSKALIMQYGNHIFNVWYIISNNKKLMLIDAETNAAPNLQEKAVFNPKD